MSYWSRSREAIRYTLAAHLVNAAFILIVFALPAAYLLSTPSVPIEIGRGVIIISFLLGALLIADWYHMHMTNSFSGLFGCLALAVLGAVATLVIASLLSDSTLASLATFEGGVEWPASRLLMRLYIVSVGMCCVAIIGIPRLSIVRAVSKESSSHTNMTPNSALQRTGDA